jgi:hypothetical protein
MPLHRWAISSEYQPSFRIHDAFTQQPVAMIQRDAASVSVRSTALADNRSYSSSQLQLTIC